MINAMRIIFMNECKLLQRNASDWAIPLTFFALILFLFALAFPLANLSNLPGCIWVASLFANCLSLQTVFLSDLENNSLEQWALSPTPLTLLLIAKLAAYWVMTQLPLLLFTLVLSLFLNLTTNTLTVLILGLFFTSPILVLLCSLSLALSLGLKQQGLLLGLIVIPLILPLFIFGINTTLLAEHHLNVTHAMAAMAGLFLLALIGLPPAIAIALRIGMDH